MFQRMLEGMFQSANYEATKAYLDVGAERHKVLTSNLANAETPGYKRVELDSNFIDNLRAELNEGHVRPFKISEISFTEDKDSNLNSDLTGNNVSSERELMLINENALRYEALGQFASSSLRQLRTAITGRNS